jgi:hypothetical protein
VKKQAQRVERGFGWALILIGVSVALTAVPKFALGVTLALVGLVAASWVCGLVAEKL